jgi:hypothetical protein
MPSAYPGEEATHANSTLFEFTLTPDGDRTRLSLCESGFASLVILSARSAGASHESHSAGRTEVLAALTRRAEQM